MDHKKGKGGKNHQTMEDMINALNLEGNSPNTSSPKNGRQETRGLKVLRSLHTLHFKLNATSQIENPKNEVGCAFLLAVYLKEIASGEGFTEGSPESSFDVYTNNMENDEFGGQCRLTDEGVVLSVKDKTLDKRVKALHQILEGPLDKEKFRRAQGNCLEYIETTHTKEKRIIDYMNQLLYSADNRFAYSITGDEKTMGGITVETLERFRDKAVGLGGEIKITPYNKALVTPLEKSFERAKHIEATQLSREHAIVDEQEAFPAEVGGTTTLAVVAIHMYDGKQGDEEELYIPQDFSDYFREKHANDYVEEAKLSNESEKAGLLKISGEGIDQMNGNVYLIFEGEDITRENISYTMEFHREKIKELYEGTALKVRKDRIEQESIRDSNGNSYVSSDGINITEFIQKLEDTEEHIEGIKTDVHTQCSEGKYSVFIADFV